MAVDEGDVLTVDELQEAWPILSPEDRVDGFRMLPQAEAHDFFLSLTALDQAQILLVIPPRERRLWLRMLAPDDAADVLQEVPSERRHDLLDQLDDPSRREIAVLLAYAEDEAGGLMSPRFARLRPEMTVDEAIGYLRRQAREHLETIDYAYVLESQQQLRGVVSLRELFAASREQRVRDIMEREVITVPEDMDQEAVAREIARYDLKAIPVVDASGVMKGIVTIDDIVDVMEEEATEDMQKLGGMAALETPYLQTSLGAMVRKRAGWLAILFLGEMLTASAMGHFEGEIAQAVVLALFVPLIISSGGNSGSQATTLVIRAMALGEVRLRDWVRIIRREIAAGLALGAILALIGLVRIVLWEKFFHEYGEHYLSLAVTVSISLMGVVTWGTVVGAMLPFIIRRIGFDPASASAPFVATLVDVFGLVIYFSVARMLLSGAIL